MVDTTPKEDPCTTHAADASAEESKVSNGKRRYIQVGHDKRCQLLQMLEGENVTIKSAAERLSINYSNAKNIVKLYRKEHRTDKLPKKPSLTLREITCPHTDSSAIPLKSALLPFYDPQEAERMMHRGSGDRTRGSGHLPQRNRVACSQMAGGPCNEVCSRATTTPSEGGSRGDTSATFNFLVYTPGILGRYGHVC